MIRRNFFVIGLLVSLCFVSAQAEYSGGTGKKADPYLIGTVQDWQQLCATQMHWASHFKVINDLDFFGVTVEPLGWAFEEGSVYYPYQYFSGTLDGQGYSFKNIVLDYPEFSRVALFHELRESTVSNLKIENIVVKGSCSAAALAATLADSTVSGCSITGSITADSSAAGLAVYCESIILSDCTAGIAVTSEGDDAGGLLCRVGGGRLENCAVEGSVHSKNGLCGGIAASCDYAFLGSCTVDAEIGSFNLDAGGLAGNLREKCAVRNCRTRGKVTARINGGGLAGFIEGSTVYESFSEAEIIVAGTVKGSGVGGLAGGASETDFYDCYARGSLAGRDLGGGLAGDMRGLRQLPEAQSTVARCYATCDVTVKEGGIAGGLTARAERMVWESSYWDQEKTGIAFSVGGEGRATTDMLYPHAENSYVGWDFDEIWQADNGEVQLNDGYPWLRNTPPFEKKEVVVPEGEEVAEGEELPEGEEVSEGEEILEGEVKPSEGEFNPTEGETAIEGEDATEGEIPPSEGEIPGEGESVLEGEEISEGELEPEGENILPDDSPFGCGCGKKSVQGPVKDLLGDWLLVALSLGVLLSGSVLAKKD
ncbi:MAG TPA: hypothetical protein PLY90_03390 [Candidatus Hydrogenedentes bacterium]|jgi:hypothetical protein|nr:MAG: The GLUG motif protein [Candidatus Hydrogenedentes bacterium ADurb.Bin170]HNZ47817.1 hypothetical protein [Candidatus Hydrogenedentota bacterium]HOD95792.1 hypothetical protein [Candidatus Hydrogenedentota bacterium]HOM47905.1 hypothetical protein [Candidatus Hydrogenedentota bacterium]HOR51170.1 hypothetical protein [Candidatus Hydrogenedentota bacterium]